MIAYATIKKAIFTMINVMFPVALTLALFPPATKGTAIQHVFLTVYCQCFLNLLSVFLTLALFPRASILTKDLPSIPSKHNHLKQLFCQCFLKKIYYRYLSESDRGKRFTFIVFECNHLKKIV